QVSPGDLQAPAQQVVFGVTDAVGDGGEGRLLGGDEQRALARALGIDLGDAHPLEKAERPQPPLRLDDLLLAERASLLPRHPRAGLSVGRGTDVSTRTEATRVRGPACAWNTTGTAPPPSAAAASTRDEA